LVQAAPLSKKNPGLQEVE